MRRPACTFEGCERPNKARGYCNTHYAQFKRGAPIVDIKPRIYDRGPICTVDDCGGPEQAMGLCAMHYQRVQRHGSTDWRDRSKPQKECRLDGCDRPSLWRGLCQRHAQRDKTCRQYGVDIEWYLQKGDAQGWVCEICELPERAVDGTSGETRDLALDHCHDGGHVRGLLCSHCNRALGLFQDDPAILRKAADYLDSHKPLW